MRLTIRKINSFFKGILENWRMHLVFLVFLGFGCVCIGRFFDLQVLNYDKFSGQAVAQAQFKQSDWQFLRGKIYFQDKNQKLIPVAINKSFPQIYAVPEEIINPIETAQAIANVTGLNADELAQKFSKPEDLYELIQKKADPTLAQKIKDLGLSGIYVNETTCRYYPYGEMASQVLGYVKDDVTDFHGQYGLEKYYDDELSVESGVGGILSFLSLKNILFNNNNYDLVSTIDYNIQKKAEELLKTGAEKWSAEKGNAIVIEPKTGRILAMVNFPNFNPNNYSKSSAGTFINYSTQMTYEPGSTFKVMTMAAGLESKKITPQTQYYDSGEVKVDDRIIKNWDLKAHGWQTMTDVIAKSLNTGVVFAESKMGHDLFYQYALQSRINQKTGIDLPGEVKGNINNLKGFQDVYFATAAFGQGITATPLGMLSIISAIANKGMMMTPYVIEKMVSSDGGNEAMIEPRENARIMEEETARLMRVMMTNAVDVNQAATIKGYQVAGKTGTAQVPDANGKYGNDTIHSFVGFVPAENPRFAVLVKLDKPEADLAGATVIPIFKELTQFILNYYEIAPTL
jgi:cell division protein FtsI/penicillin-binding protein 2